jgi:hypothetical protein
MTPDAPPWITIHHGMATLSLTSAAPDSYLRKINDGKRVLYTALASSVPREEYREVENAGHTTIHTDRPDAVVRAIRDLVDRIQ